MPTSSPSVFALPRTVWAIGIVTLLLNISNVVIFSLSPHYLTAVLGVSVASLGVYEGLVEAVAWSTRVFAGVISDYMRKRKPLLLIAASLTALSRPIFALASSLTGVFFARTLDRLGNGLQATPREALVGDVAPPNSKGACYGLRQTLTVTGSLLGALLIMVWTHLTGGSDSATAQDSGVYQIIFLLASIPPIVGLLILFLFVKEAKERTLANPMAAFEDRFSRKDFRLLGSAYWRVVFVAFVFMLSNYSGAFMILQAKAITAHPHVVPLTMVFQNLACMIAAYPIGRLSDKIDRRKLLAAGFALTVLSNAFLGWAEGLVTILVGATFWGFQLGIAQSLLVSKVADATVARVRGTAFGLYYLAVALSLFVTNYVGGKVFEQEHFASFLTGPQALFALSSLFALLAMACLPLIRSARRAGPTRH
ncbi:MAG: MFS transporter [Proteobacteria bacterium]|nr:MFS transporter [Pseudomonadota bacterium]